MLRSISPSFLIASALLLSGAAFAGDAPLPFAEATFTEVVNDVQVVSHADAKPVKAVKDARFNAPDLVKTGRKSRAQLTAADGTIARVGSNSVFAFDKSTRQMSLESGSVLFHSPSGKGGGAIVTNSATASVIGTTIIVTATADGGFKLLVLEGVAKVTYPSGQVVNLNAGQMTFVLPEKTSGEKGGQPGPILSFDLAALVADSALVSGFESPLASGEKIRQAINEQGVLLDDGDLKSTGLFIVGARSGEEFLLSDPTLIIQAQVRNNAVKDASVPDRLRESLKETVTFGGEITGATPVPEKNIFRTGVRVLQDMLPTGRYVPREDLVGILVGALSFNTGTADLSSLDGAANEITLGGLAGKTEIKGGITFTGLAQSRRLRVAGGELAIADGSQVSVNFDASVAGTPTKAEFVSLTEASFTGVSFLNASGEVELGALTGSLTLDTVTVKAGIAEEPSRKTLPVNDTAFVFAANESPANAAISPVAGTGAPNANLNLRAKAGDIVVTGGSYAASGEISVEALGRVAVTNTTWSAQDVSVRAETIVLNNTSLAPESTATLHTRDGLLNLSYDGSVATEATGEANLNGFNFSGVDGVEPINLIWSPNQNIGDVSRALHILDATTEDFRGSKLDYARTVALTLDSASKFTPFSYLFTADDITVHSNYLLNASDFGLASDPKLDTGDESYSPYTINGLFAKNLTLKDAAVELPSSDRSSRVDIVAGVMDLSGDITFKPDTTRDINTGNPAQSDDNPSTRSVELRAGSFKVAPGTVLRAGIAVDDSGIGAVRIFSLSANALDLQNFTLENRAGLIHIISLGDLKISQTRADTGKLVATGSHIDLSGKTVTLTGAMISAVEVPANTALPAVIDPALIDQVVTSNEQPVRSTEVIPSSAGFSNDPYLKITGTVAVTIEGGQLKASTITVLAGSAGDADSPNAPETSIDIKGSPIFVASNVAEQGISMQARTINISDTAFPADTEIRLRSGSGILNLGSSLNGAVNFIRSVSVKSSDPANPTILVNAANEPVVAGINRMVWVSGHGEPNRIYVKGAASEAASGLTGTGSSSAAAIHIQQIGAPNAAGISAVGNAGLTD